MPHELILRQSLKAWIEGSRASAFASITDLQAVIGSETGIVRKENQDRAVVARLNFGSTKQPSFTVVFVCDGIGGLTGGADCAELAIQEALFVLTTSKNLDLVTRLESAVRSANSAVYEKYSGRGGTTLVCLLVSDRETIAISVGDSRIYLSEDGTLKQLTTDDTIAGELSRLHGIKLDQGRLDAASRSLAQFIGMGDGLEPRIYKLSDRSRERMFLMTTDGAHGIGADILQTLFENSPSPEFVKRLLTVSRWCGGHDNATAVLIYVDDISRRARYRLDDVDILEIWTTTGKLELPLTIDMATPKANSFQQALYELGRAKKAKTYKSKKNISSPSPHVTVNDPVSSERPQRKLAIEIVDEPKAPPTEAEKPADKGGSSE